MHDKTPESFLTFVGGHRVKIRTSIFFCEIPSVVRSIARAQGVMRRFRTAYSFKGIGGGKIK